MDSDLKKFAAKKAINYLHQGCALDVFSSLLPSVDRILDKSDLINRLPARNRPELGTVLGAFEPQRKCLRISAFRQALEETQDYRHLFRKLGCRGFSYELDRAMRDYDRQYIASCQLGRNVDLRLALIANTRLFYPPRVKAYLEGVAAEENHYSRDGMPAIAFCLGRKTRDAWYVSTIQSGFSSGPSHVREHFRGWRKVLFANLVGRALGKTNRIFLCRAEDVERACYPGSKDAGYVPDRWKKIYDGTAAEWGMRPVVLAEPIDIQIYRRKTAVYADQVYELQLRATGAKRLEETCSATR